MSRKHKEDTRELFNKLSSDFHELVSNKELLETSTEKFLNGLIDEITVGIIFDIHRKYKTKAYDLEGQDDGNEVEKYPCVEVFSQTVKKTEDCICVICGRASAPIKFGDHLQTCMGLGRKSKNTRNHVTNNHVKEKEHNCYNDTVSDDNDDDDDDDWRSGYKSRKKKKNRSRKRKPKGGSKKSTDSDSADSISVDVEADDDDDDNSSLGEFIHENSNGSSSGESTSSTHSNHNHNTLSLRKKENSKNKKNGKKDRLSPSMSNGSIN